MASSTSAYLRVLAVLLAVVALNAIGGGIYGLLGAEGVPREWLHGSPFSDYRVPSLILLIAVGGSSLVAAHRLLTGAPRAPRYAMLAGGVLVLWIVVQVAIIGLVSWLQPLMAFVGLVILVMAVRSRRSYRDFPREIV